MPGSLSVIYFRTKTGPLRLPDEYGNAAVRHRDKKPFSPNVAPKFHPLPSDKNLRSSAPSVPFHSVPYYATSKSVYREIQPIPNFLLSLFFRLKKLFQGRGREPRTLKFDHFPSFDRWPGSWPESKLSNDRKGKGSKVRIGKLELYVRRGEGRGAKGLDLRSRFENWGGGYGGSWTGLERARTT